MSDERQKPAEPKSQTGCCAPAPKPAVTSCCCASSTPATPDAGTCTFVIGSVATGAGEVPTVSTRLTLCDRWGTIKARWGAGRMAYTVTPGLYAIGKPGKTSPVLVTANYKLSFDRLRSACDGLDAWILVLDTDGINVWCAAGKGSFGTNELIERIAATGLAAVVDHRRLILPQLGAPGVAAHEVKKASGFKVVWGPIRAEDLRTFLAAGLEASAEMRRKTFDLEERFVLIPVELVSTFKPLALILPVLILLGGLGGGAGYRQNLLNHGLPAALAVLGGVIGGAILTPILLPWLPGRAFAVKGLLPGLAAGLLLAAVSGPPPVAWPQGLEVAAWLLLATAVSAFVAMNFTGASTYTSLSGVRREMKIAVPLQIGAAVLGLALWASALVMA